MNPTATPEISNDIDDVEAKKELEKLVRSRRRKLRQRAKALMSAMEGMGEETEPFVVLPMPQMHAGVKRDGQISSSVTVIT